MNTVKTPSAKRSQLGQSLTEVALVLPIILLIIAGLVEISNLIVSQTKLDAAVRKAVRFGAQGGVDEGIRTSLLQSVTPTLVLDPEQWDVYVIRATVNADGNDYVGGSWSFEPIFGYQNVRPISSIDVADVQAEILGNLRQQSANDALAANHQLVGMMAFHSVESLLGMDNFLRGFNNVRAFSVMRLTPVAQSTTTNGCDVFPIAIEVGARSLNGPDDFPDPSEFEYPESDIPVLTDFFHPSRIPSTTSMLDAKQGQLFVIPFNLATNGHPEAHPAMFDFTRWDWYGIFRQREALANSLPWPGNSSASCADGANGDAGWEHPILGCALDSELNIGDPVRVSVAMPNDMGNNNEIKEALQEHVDYGRTLRVMLFEIDDAPPPATERAFSSDEQRKVSGFVVLRPLGYLMHANHATDWILFEFIRMDDSCGASPSG